MDCEKKKKKTGADLAIRAGEGETSGRTQSE